MNTKQKNCSKHVLEVIFFLLLESIMSFYGWKNFEVKILDCLAQVIWWVHLWIIFSPLTLWLNDWCIIESTCLARWLIAILLWSNEILTFTKNSANRVMSTHRAKFQEIKDILLLKSLHISFFRYVSLIYL